MRAIFKLCAVCFIFAQPLQAETLSGGMEMLKKMSRAADELNYSGEFVYVKDGKIAAMKISHLRTKAGVQQKLMALDGSMREIIQQDDIVACVLPDQGMGMREKRQVKQPFNLSISGRTEDVERNYKIEYLGKGRVANRDCEKLKITPKDAYRYGYALCIDSKNHLLLRSELSEIDGEILESYMFVDVTFDNISPVELVSATAPKTLEWIDDTLPNSDHKLLEVAKKWRVISNESGFKVERYIERVSPVIQTQISHLVLGDGLAKVSVFVTPVIASANKYQKATNMGSLNSYSRKVDDYMITVIGEVPQQTVTLIANNTAPK